jgi:hypothetical protein
MLSNLNLISTGPVKGNDRALWLCKCGRTAEIVVKDVLRGHTKSCGQCKTIPESILCQKFGKLHMKSPSENRPSQVVVWICECGKERNARIRDVTTGKIKSCGKCREISFEEMKLRKFGKLRMKDPKAVTAGSNTRTVWICDCGRETQPIVIKSVTRGLVKSCGRCSEISAEIMRKKKFGKLRIKNPIPVTPGSGKKILWVCDCGREVKSVIAHVFSGHTKSCGHCWMNIKDNYDRSLSEIRKLRTPISPNRIPRGFPTPLEVITKVAKPFRAKCQMCGSEYYPRWGDIRLGKSLTCGCSTNRVSSNHKEIHDFLKSLGIETQLEYKIGHFSYDLFIPSRKLILEHHGLLWHSRPGSKRLDIKRYLNATQAGYAYIAIFEDEWLFKREQIKNILLHRIRQNLSKSIRPKLCEVKKIKNDVADPFYEKNHYIGACKAKINYGAFYKNQLVAAISFKRPTRQTSKCDWELVRMASDPNIHVYGIWSKLITEFKREFNLQSIVSFSDNRLFDGKTYEKIGFKFDGHVKSNYYWWKNKKRYHKSNLRKPPGETMTETELRQSEGYRKIWDLGKKRWVLT